MKKLIAASALLLASLGLSAATEMVVGSYNIRVITPADLGLNSWDNRKEYVASTVLDNQMDIVGFNEVINGKQQEDLMRLLPAYGFSGWNGEGYDRMALNLIGYRKDKFTLLDEGLYFLSRTFDHWTESWDNSEGNVRHTSWAKFRVNDSGEEFFFFVTHLDHKGQTARHLQSRINLAMVRRIAGHYPVIMTGDQNSTPTRLNYFNIFTGNFDDAYVAGGGEAKYADDNHTSGQWTPGSTGDRIDYIWSNGFDIADYQHHKEMYDLGAMPSDHLAISARLTMQAVNPHNRYVYVAEGGNGDGSKEAPVGSLQDAISLAHRGDTIYVAAGDYKLEKTLSLKKTLMIFGGYNSDFTEVVGLSKVIGNDTFRCVSQSEMADNEFRNFGFYNGNAASETGDGGGIMSHGSRVILRYCEIVDCKATRDGGGVDATGQVLFDHVKFIRNRCGRYGGAFCTDNPSKRYYFNQVVNNCLFDSNVAADGSAFYLPRFRYGYVANSTFVDNEASAGSTVYIRAVSGTDESQLDAHLSVFNNTFILNSASGEDASAAMRVWIEATGPASIVGNTILSNSGKEGASGAVHIVRGKPYIAANVIALNEGGDVTIDATSGIAASHNFYTSANCISYKKNGNDIVPADYAEALSLVAAMFNGKVEDGKFIPALTTPEAVVAPSVEAPYELMTPPQMFDYTQSVSSTPKACDFTVPVVKVINPVVGSANLCKVTQTRLSEKTVKADFNFDCTEETYLLTDATGAPRPSDNTATMGAVEYNANDGVVIVEADAHVNGSMQSVEYYNMQGMRVENPSNGIFICRQGSKTTKVVIR